MSAKEILHACRSCGGSGGTLTTTGTPAQDLWTTCLTCGGSGVTTIPNPEPTE